jgi:nicotinamidase-related amidase
LDIIPKISALCRNPHKHYDIVFTRFIADSNPTGTWVDYNTKYADINRSEYLNAIVDDLKPYLPYYPTVDKSTYSCYKNPQLKALVDSHDTIALCGVVADCCVLATALDIIDTGKPILYLADAVGEYKLNSGKAVLDIMHNMKLHVTTLTADEYSNI